jgi:hypothetical protein
VSAIWGLSPSGIDGSVAYNPIRELTIYAFGSWNDSSIHDNIQTGLLPVGVTCDNVAPNSIDGRRACAFTEGNRESGTPKYTYGLSGLGTVGPVDLGITAKRTGPRFIFDNGAAMFRGDIGITTATPGRVVEEQVFGKTAPAYWLVNLDARLNLDKLGITALGMKHTYFQLNVYNLFDKFYVGGFGGGLAQSLRPDLHATSTPACTPTVTVPTGVRRHSSRSARRGRSAELEHRILISCAIEQRRAPRERRRSLSGRTHRKLTSWRISRNLAGLGAFVRRAISLLSHTE